MTKGQTLQAKLEVPSLAQTFDSANFYDWQTSRTSFEGEEGARLADEMLDDAEEKLARAIKTLPLLVRTQLKPLGSRLSRARALLQDRPHAPVLDPRRAARGLARRPASDAVWVANEAARLAMRGNYEVIDDLVPARALQELA